MMEPRLKFKK